MPFTDALRPLAVDDPRKIVKVVASDGKSGDQGELSYTNCKVIGNGSFGIIRKVRRRSDGVILARKELNFERMSERDRKQIVAEVNILKDLHHENIVRYIDRVCLLVRSGHPNGLTSCSRWIGMRASCISLWSIATAAISRR